ncbi:MerR family transcriptional regulator [Deinococcus sp. MIMF12]|uniref:MerR family transcriptional regulator n=1 Tax=Deinococcus rhizophilus TaxID=3049544 RepID=A0ABT7JPY2_9DEIO|nr:MerR family transcriptional regulator [Deinococcus rhizophilus]MDL2345694.1 MerR family transcriptional regulator [Deinococcus rhizophilus]
MIDVQADWSGGIEALVEEANLWLARLLPAARASRPKDEVNPRLVRHYTTQGLLPAPRREGRDARYGRLHLVALLALRRLMADGLSGRALTAALVGQDEAGLEQLALEGIVDREVQAGDGDDNGALRYLRQLAVMEAPRRARVVKPRPPTPVPAALPEFLLEPRKKVSQTTRVVVRPDLELQIGQDFEWPETEPEWRALLKELGATLRDVQGEQVE